MIGIAGCLTDDCGVVHEHGLDAVFAVVNRAMSLPEALATATTNLQLTARNVAALYLLRKRPSLLADAVHRPDPAPCSRVSGPAWHL